MNRALSPNRLAMLGRHMLVALAGFGCTLPALAGVSIPNTPLQTGSTVPPNLTLLFDNSGSMYWRYLYVHKSDNSMPTIAVPAGVNGAASAATSTNTGDETSKDSLGTPTDAYGNTDCEKNGSSGSSDTAAGCVAPSINNAKYIVDQTYVTNGLYYNPSVTYTPWTYPDGTQQASAPYNGAYQSHNFSNNYNWTAVDGTTSIGLTSPLVDLSTHTETYYIPKTATDTYCSTLDTTDAKCYYRYQILGSTEFPSSSGLIYRSELLQANDVGNTPVPTTACVLSNQSTSNGVMKQVCSITVPSGVSSLTITFSGGTSSKAVMYEREGAAPTTGTFDKSKTTSGTITVANPAADTYYVGLYGNGGNISGISFTATTSYNFVVTKGATNAGCDDTGSSNYNWRNCVQMRPTGRSEVNERQNFANWYSFYGTRMKTAKASISAAFGSLGTIPRVGFRDIWDRADIDIPVCIDDGLFEDKSGTTTNACTSGSTSVLNKTHWFQKVMGEVANDGTPLRISLQNMGKYYSDNDAVNSHTGATGPYGPQTGTDRLSCRQNFTILTTDGYWNDTGGSDNYSPATGVAGADNSAGFPYGDNATVSPDSGTTLADIAYYYYANDLNTGVANKVPTSTADPEAFQHMVTFTISIGAAGTLNPTNVLNYIASHAAYGGALPSWPDPGSGNGLTTIDDLFHAAVNGHGSFVIASDPTDFVTALTNALSSIAQRTSASSNVSASGARLSTSTQLFQSNFVIGAWTGDVGAYAISTTGVVSTTPTWLASQHLPAWGSRSIFTWNGTSGVTFPTAAQVTALGGTSVSGYIKGDQAKEVQNGGTYRNRTTVLGDMIDSSPVFVPADTTVSPNTPAMLYVGGNDGMLHGFDATTGVERFAYVPGGVNMGNLATLTNKAYVHQYFVDGAIAVSTKAQTTTSTDTTGKDILVGVLGRGGHTVYALDVSDPANFAAGKVLWEYTDTDMGNSLGTPVITRLNTGEPGVIISNGYNSTSGHAIIYVLNIRTGALVKKLDSVAGGTDDTNSNVNLHSNGMTTPKGWDADRNGTVDLIYGGDLLGNVWVFDVSDGSAANWAPVYGSVAAPQPLYTAKDASGNRQPITGGFAIGLNPATFDRWVFFGTGRYLTSGDPADHSLQSWYGIIDPGPTGTSPYPTPITSVTTRNSTVLKQRSITVETTVNGTSVRAFGAATSGDMAGLKGWYVDLQDPTARGERIVTDTTLLAGVLLAASIIPSNDACDLGGTGFINAIDAFTGGSVTNPFFDISGNGTVDSGDKVTDGSGNSLSAGSIDLGVGMPSLPAFIQKVITSTGSSGNLGQVIVNNPTNSGRISWREVLIGN